MSKIGSIQALEKFGRVRLSQHFFMRDFLYSEISNFHSIPNVPDDPDLAIAVGEKLCQELLDPLFETFGNISIRSSYRSPGVNQYGNENHLNCASNASNYAGHIVKDFCKRLERKLKASPPLYSDAFSVKIWLDHFSMKGVGEFEGQTDIQCKKSSLALFLLSDLWRESSACKREATYFPSPDNRVQIQLSGNWVSNPDDYKCAPIYPIKWNDRFGNLLEVWDESAAVKDAFVECIRNEICCALEVRLKIKGPNPINCISRHEENNHSQLMRKPEEIVDALTNIGGPKQLVQIVQDGKIQSPSVLEREHQEESIDAIKLLMKWAKGKSSSNRVFALLGSFGSGKTTTSQLFTQALLKANKKDPSFPFPVYLDLRELADAYQANADAPGLLEIIRRSISSEIRDSADIEAILKTMRSKPCVVIFDGLDEVGTRIGTERISSLYRDLMEIVPRSSWISDAEKKKADWKSCPVRILVTCRDHFFRSHMQEKSILCDNDRNVGLRKSGDYTPVKTIYMAPFTPEQIKEYFTDNLGPENGERIFASLSSRHDLTELATKPLMAHYILEIADELQQDIDKGSQINAARIYELLFQRALERDSDKRPLLTTHDRQCMLKTLAGFLWIERKSSIPADELEDWFDTYALTQPGVLLALQGVGAEGRHRFHTELRNASLLIRDFGDAFRFVHTSFFEYFLARYLLDQLENDRLPDTPALSNISRETFLFLFDILDLRGMWPAFMKMTDRLLAAGNSQHRRIFALQIRSQVKNSDRDVWDFPKGADLSILDLSELKYSGPGRFDHVSFARTNIRGAAFENAEFYNCDFEGTQLENAVLDNCTFEKCFGQPTPAFSAISNNCNAVSKTDTAILSAIGMIVLPPVTNEGLISAANSSSQILFNRSSSYNGAVFSPDGKTILTASGDSTARLYDTKSGKELRRYEGHSDLVLSAVFSPDGKTILTASGDRTARLYDTKSGKELRRYEGHSDWVRSAVFSPDGKTILTASGDGSTRLFDQKAYNYFLEIIQFRDSYAVFSNNGQFNFASHNAWKYLHTVDQLPDGSVKVQIPKFVPATV